MSANTPTFCPAPPPLEPKGTPDPSPVGPKSPPVRTMPQPALQPRHDPEGVNLLLRDLALRPSDNEGWRRLRAIISECATGPCRRMRLDAEDVIQDSAHKIWKRLSSPDRRTVSEGWVRKVVRNTTLDARRRRERRERRVAAIPVAEPVSEGPSAHQLVETKELLGLLRSRLNSLDGRDYRHVLCYLVEGSVRGAEKVLDVPPHTVRRSIKRAGQMIFGAHELR